MKESELFPCRIKRKAPLLLLQRLEDPADGDGAGDDALGLLAALHHACLPLRKSVRARCARLSSLARACHTRAWGAPRRPAAPRTQGH